MSAWGWIGVVIAAWFGLGAFGLGVLLWREDRLLRRQRAARRGSAVFEDASGTLWITPRPDGSIAPPSHVERLDPTASRH